MPYELYPHSPDGAAKLISCLIAPVVFARYSVSSGCHGDGSVLICGVTLRIGPLRCYWVALSCDWIAVVFIRKWNGVSNPKVMSKLQVESRLPLQNLTTDLDMTFNFEAGHILFNITRQKCEQFCQIMKA